MPARTMGFTIVLVVGVDFGPCWKGMGASYALPGVYRVWIRWVRRRRVKTRHHTHFGSMLFSTMCVYPLLWGNVGGGERGKGGDAFLGNGSSCKKSWQSSFVYKVDKRSNEIIYIPHVSF